MIVDYKKILILRYFTKYLTADVLYSISLNYCAKSLLINFFIKEKSSRTVIWHKTLDCNQGKDLPKEGRTRKNW